MQKKNLQKPNMIASVLTLIIFVLQIYISLGEKIDNPTLKPIDPFSASSDAGVFKKELLDDKATDRDELIKIWFHRTYDQRRQIADYYDKICCDVWDYSYRRCPLSTKLTRISDDTMCDLYQDSLIPPEGILAKVIQESITGQWKEVGAIEEAVCANDKDMKDKIEQYYQAVFKDSVKIALATFRKEDQEYQHVMQNYCWKGLCQETKITPEDADREAEALREIHPGDDKERFKQKLIELLDKNCEPDMKLIFEKYRKGDDDGIAEAVEKAFKESERVERAYYRLVKYVENTCKYYSDELYHAVDGAGTNTDKINRITLTRAERDLKCIIDKYKEQRGETFTQRLRTDTVEGRWLESIRYLCGKA